METFIQKALETQGQDFNAFILGGESEDFAEAANKFLVGYLLQVRKHSALSTRLCKMRANNA